MDNSQFIESNKLGGDFVSPDASFAAKKFILAARAIMYENGGEVITQAIEGSKRLVDGGVPIVAMVISSVESKLGELSDKDLEVVAFHLAGTIVEAAMKDGDPDAMADDGKEATMEIAAGVVDLLQQQDLQEQQPQQPQVPQPMPLMPSGAMQNG